jgi:methylenetetrahydrofolate reductase (NADPH)
MTAKADSTFRELLSAGRFVYGAELVTTRGLRQEDQRPPLVALGEALAADPRIAWISITDNPGGNPMLPADWIAGVLKTRGTQLVIHLTCKDLNRNGLESAAWRYAADGFDNVLALTGDYPVTGFRGQALPVFDLDSVSLISMLRSFNDGFEAVLPNGRTQRLPRTNFFIGCAVAPFKRHERELMPQYLKLARKIRCGADWVIPQLGYDMRKFHEVQLFLEWAQIPRPVVGNVYVLSRTLARLFNRNKLPGCVVSDELLALAERYAAGPDKGRAFFAELAAKQLAVFKGLGFAGGYLGGVSKAEAFAQIIDMAEGFAEDDWREFAREIQFSRPGEFYLFERDPESGLGDRARVNPDYLRSLDAPPATTEVNLNYRASRLVHRLAFTPDRGVFTSLQRAYRQLEQGGSRKTLRALHAVEHTAKQAMYGCEDCGDCSLPETAYLCPRSACSKTQRNGPCGGSSDGRCELEDKDCLWARAYDRLKHYRESQAMLDGPPVFANPALSGSSSWANAFLGRDHQHVEAPAAQAQSRPPQADATAASRRE